MPGTGVENVLPYASKVDIVLVMTVEPGLGGQEFMNNASFKVETLQHKYPDLEVKTDCWDVPSKVRVQVSSNFL